MRSGRQGRAARWRWVGLAAAISLGAGGCVSLQANGPVTLVTDADPGSASQVQELPQPPLPGAMPAPLVNGFLLAAGSGEANQHISSQYLTANLQPWFMAHHSTVIVLADGTGTPTDNGTDDQNPSRPHESVPGQGQGAQVDDVTVTGEEIGQLDANGQYTAVPEQQVSFDFGVTQTSQGYRITDLPQNFGVLLSRTQFEDEYNGHTVYLRAAPGAPGSSAPGQLVPTQVYLPAVYTDQDVALDLAQLTVSGNLKWPGVDRDPPLTGDGTTVEGVDLVGSGPTSVHIKADGQCAEYQADQGPCYELAQELESSYSELSTKPSSVDVYDDSTGGAVPVGTAQAPSPGTGRQPGASCGGRQTGQDGIEFYAVDEDGVLQDIENGMPGVTQASKPVERTDGRVLPKLSAVSASTPSVNCAGGAAPGQIAMVSADGTKLYTGQLQRDVVQGQRYSKLAGFSQLDFAGEDIQSLSWAGHNLWFIAKVDGLTGVYQCDEGGEGSCFAVDVIGSPGTPVELSAAPDGVRVAVEYQNVDGQAVTPASSSVWVGQAHEDADTGGWTLDMTRHQVVADAWTKLDDFDWYSEDSLAVLGTQSASVPVLGLYEVYADGSPVWDSLNQQPFQVPPPSQAAEMFWSADGQPVADENGQLYLLYVEGQAAQKLGIEGTSPTY